MSERKQERKGIYGEELKFIFDGEERVVLKVRNGYSREEGASRGWKGYF